MDNPAKIIMIGSGCIDEYYELDYVPALGEKTCCKPVGKIVGGMIGNAAAVAASYGMDVYLMDRVNRSEDTQTVLEDFRQNGVKLDLVEFDETLPDVKCLIFLKDGERIIYVIPTRKSQLVLTEQQLRTIGEAQYVYTTLAELRCFREPKAAVAAMRDGGAKLVLDVEYLEQSHLELEWYLLQQADILFINEEGDRQLGEKVGEGYRDRLKQDTVIVLTKGSEGSVVYTGNTCRHVVPAYSVEPVDTTGAGDTFNASFVYGLSRGWDMLRSAQFASAAAARAISHLGARSGAVTVDKVLEFMNQQRGD